MRNYGSLKQKPTSGVEAIRHTELPDLNTSDEEHNSAGPSKLGGCNGHESAIAGGAHFLIARLTFSEVSNFIEFL